MSQRPQWEIDAIDAAEDAREQCRAVERRDFMRRFSDLRVFWFFEGPKVKKGRGQRRNRRNRR